MLPGDESLCIPLMQIVTVSERTFGPFERNFLNERPVLGVVKIHGQAAGMRASANMPPHRSTPECPLSADG